MNKIKFSKSNFSEFQNDPQGTAKKYNLDIEDGDFYKKDYKNMSYDEFKDYISKSRYYGYFDFTSY